MPHKFRAYVAGYRGGKTYAGSMARCIHHLKFGRINSGYFAPTYSHIRDTFYPTIEEVAFNFGIKVDIKTSDKEVHYFRGGRQIGTTICRSMDNPGRIVGFEIGDGMIDEFDVMPMDKAMYAWRKIIARMSYKQDGLRNGLDVTTTPEGFLATHKLFVEDVLKTPSLGKSYGLIQASTYDNAANLPDDYIPSLLGAYTPELVLAYVNGQFVNLKSGTVYRYYNRTTHNSIETIRPTGEKLIIGMDFNVQKMAACIFVERGDAWHQVAELKELFDTPDMIRVLNERYPAKIFRRIVYPDASGGSRDSGNASITDLHQLRLAGFEVRAHAANPYVKDRVNAVNTAFSKGRLFVNAAACPVTAGCLEKQAYDANGEPDKKSGFDHQCFHPEQLVMVNNKLTEFSVIPREGVVLCPDGVNREYINGGITRDFSRMLLVTLNNKTNVKCTPEHKFLTTSGWCEAWDLTGKVLVDQKLLAEANKYIRASHTTYVENISRETELGYIGLFGQKLMVSFLKDSISIIRILIGQIMRYLTLNLYKEAVTLRSTDCSEQPCRERLSTRLLNGTGAKRGELGMLSTTKKQKSFYIKKIKSMFARIAQGNFCRTEVVRQSSAQEDAAHDIDSTLVLTTRKETARYVMEFLKETNIAKQKHALENAPICLRVQEIDPSPAYCLTVPGYGMFSVGNIVASNCDAFGYPIAYEMPIIQSLRKVSVGGGL